MKERIVALQAPSLSQCRPALEYGQVWGGGLGQVTFGMSRILLDS
jgi:hypothetical protein